jgi:DeoR/GlpR family transcriptional regulator of sugar metabolism
MSKKSQRHDRIVSVLEANPAIRSSELAELLDVSAETVRRDLAELDASGRIKRTYGGAVRAKAFEPALAERSKLHIAARERISSRAVERVEGADSMFISGGATTLHFARALRLTDRPLTVLTPAFSIATELCTNPLIQVMSLPGIVEPKEGLVHGADTIRSIAQFRASVAVVGASGVDEAGASEALLHAAQVYSAMIAAADTTVVLADSSKFGHRSLQQILAWSDDTALVTDTTPPDRLREAIVAAGAEVVVA